MEHYLPLSHLERDATMDTRGRYEGSVHQELLATGEEDMGKLSSSSTSET